MLPSPMRALGRRHQDNLPDELHLSVLTGRTKKIKHLVRKGVHVESLNALGQTPLFCASFGGDYEVVKVLLRLGANPNRRCGSGGAAPIHAASYRGSRRVLRTLVEAGGDLSLRDAELQTPREYACKQPSPLRRQKILEFFDLLFAMTLHRIASTTLPHSAAHSSTGAFISEGGSNAGTLKGHKLKKGFFGGSQLSLSRKVSHQSTASVWSSCVSEVPSPPPSVPPEGVESPQGREVVLTPNLHKSVSCHLLDQLCVTTSLPLLSPAQLQRPHTPSPAYTCGGPTVYSAFSWLGTPVTVRRPTPALAMTKQGTIISEGNDGGSPDQDAVRSLLQELTFLRRLRHPGFLEVMAACHVTHPSPDHVTLVYQHVPHGSLYHHLHLQHHDLCIGGAVDILIGLVEALLFIHAHGWFHCGVSSHALHLVSLGSAKLGGFEYAFESQVKGVGMRAEHLGKAAWLRPWQAPEVVLENMVSVRSEVYSVAAVIWEIWSGMPPWAGVEEEEVSKRVGKGEVLPSLKGVSLSLVSYLTEYGLKRNAHERELDLQEVHTMLRSLRIQCNEEERVPAVTSWGPPSVPNTPVVGRHTDSLPSTSHLDSSLTSSSGELRLGDAGFLSLGLGKGRKGWQRQDQQQRQETRKVPAFSNQLGNRVALQESKEKPKSSFERAHENVRRQFALMAPFKEQSLPTKESDAPTTKTQVTSCGLKSEASRDSGFSTPCSRTPSPTCDNITTSKSPSTSIFTSTPVRPGSKGERQKPDLLPNRVTPKAFMSSSVHDSPDLVRSGTSNIAPDAALTSKSCTTSPRLRGSDDFTFVRNAAKRAFLQQGGGDESDGSSSTTSSDRERKSSVPVSIEHRRDLEVVKRGLSLSNICNSAHSWHPATVFTRTTSHISLTSSGTPKSSASSGDVFRSKPPQRTISQITLTLKKLSVSDSSSSVSSSDSHTKKGEVTGGSEELPRRPKRQVEEREWGRVLSKPLDKAKSEERRVSKELNYNEIVGIKPASHQLTRHSSSCSLASGPPSPAHNFPVSIVPLGSCRTPRRTNSHDSLPNSPRLSYPSSTKFKTLPPPTRPLSVFSDKGSLLTEATLPNSKGHLRRHSDNAKRTRRPRRRQEMEFKEEFIDDEFDANLYDQPHMQLSVGSAENLLENKLTYSLVEDSASSSSLSPSQGSRQVTSSEEDDETAATKRARKLVSSRPLLKPQQETATCEAVPEPNTPPTSSKPESKGPDNKEKRVPCAQSSTSSVSGSELDDDAFWKGSSRGSPSEDDPLKEFEPLKSVRTLRTLEKSFSNYLPTYSIASDTEEESVDA